MPIEKEIETLMSWHNGSMSFQFRYENNILAFRVADHAWPAVFMLISGIYAGPRG